MGFTAHMLVLLRPSSSTRYIRVGPDLPRCSKVLTARGAVFGTERGGFSGRRNKLATSWPPPGKLAHFHEWFKTRSSAQAVKPPGPARWRELLLGRHVSGPASPTSVSSPSRPSIESAPSPPINRSFLLPPRSVSLPFWPLTQLADRPYRQLGEEPVASRVHEPRFSVVPASAGPEVFDHAGLGCPFGYAVIQRLHLG